MARLGILPIDVLRCCSKEYRNVSAYGGCGLPQRIVVSQTVRTFFRYLIFGEQLIEADS